jgi:molecular chaperone GrpE
MTKHKHEHEEKQKKHDCHCENCDCDENKKDCECDNCDCQHEHEHDHKHGHHHHEHEHGQHNDDEQECECEDCDCEQADKASEYLEALMRSQAEFDNYRKRTETYATKAKEEGIVLAVQKILPVIDSFTAAEKQLTKEEFSKGLHLVKEQLESSLSQLGVTKIKALHEEFDPNLHEAIMAVEDKSKKSQTVVEVLQEGYKLKDRVIRHSVVKITQ